MLYWNRCADMESETSKKHIRGMCFLVVSAGICQETKGSYLLRLYLLYGKRKVNEEALDTASEKRDKLCLQAAVGEAQRE